LLGDLLEKRGLLSLPESIRRSLVAGGGRRLPDVSVTVADLAGVRIILEGRIGDNAPIKAALFKKAKGRVEEGLSPIALAVLYPPELRLGASLQQLRNQLEKATLTVRVVSEGSDGDWATTTIDELTDVLRRSYEVLVSEDVVTRSVTELERAIETASATFVAVPAGPARLRTLLGIPEETITPPPKDRHGR
jgi:hypothetical protein